MNWSATAGHKALMGATSNSAKTPSRRWLKAGSLAASLVLLSATIASAPILWLVWIDPFGGAPHPTDAELVAQFKRHRGMLERVVAMARDDDRFSVSRRISCGGQSRRPAFRPSGSGPIGNCWRCRSRHSEDDQIWFLVPRELSIINSARFLFASSRLDARIVTTSMRCAATVASS